MTDSKKTKTTETKTTHTRVLKRTSADGETKKHHHSSHTKDSHLSSTKKKTFTPKNIKEDMEAKVDAFFEMNKESGIRKLVSATKLMEAGAHLGLPPKS
jgi:hypothetical protein